MEESDRALLRGREASHDIPTPAPTVRTRSPSTSTWLDRLSIQERAVRRLFHYTLLPVDTYPSVIQSLSYSDLSDDIEAWVERLPQDSRPRSRTDMKERVKEFQNRPRLRRHSPAPSLPRRPVSANHQPDDDVAHVAHHSMSIDETNLQLGLPRSNAPAITNSSEKCFSESTEHSPNDGDLDDHPHPLTPSTQFSYHDTKSWHTSSHEGNNESDAEYPAESSRPSTSQSYSLDEAAYCNAEGYFQDGPGDLRKLFTPKEQWQSLRRVLAEDEYSEGFVDEVFLLLDDLSECSDYDDPPDMKNSDTVNLSDDWQRFVEWRALPFDGSLLPSDFLHVDEHQRDFKICLEGSQAHDAHLCLCAAPDDNLNNLWVTSDGLSPYATTMLEKEDITLEETERYDHFGNSLLHFLAARGPIDVLFKALEVAVDTSILNFGGQTFVHCLCPDWFNGDLSPLQRLLGQLVQRGFNFSQRDSYGQTVLHIWAMRLDWESLLPLLSNSAISACIGQRDAFGYRPLNIHRDVDGLCLPVPSLQQPEKSCFEITRESASCSLSIKYIPQLMVSLLVYPPISYDCDIFTIIKDTTRCEVSVKHLLPHLAAVLSSENVFDSDDKGQNALHRLAICAFAVKTSSASSKSKRTLLLSVGDADLEDCNLLGLICGHLLHLRHSLLRMFLSQGVDVNAYNAFGNTVLMEFVMNFHYEDGTEQPLSILEILLQHGASVNARNRDGETALQIAARHGRKAVIELLIDNDANIHARNRKGQSALQILSDQISEFKGTGPDQQPLKECYEWLSSNPIGCVPKPSILDEYSSGNIWLGIAQPYPSFREKFNSILSGLQSTEQGSDIPRDPSRGTATGRLEDPTCQEENQKPPADLELPDASLGDGSEGIDDISSQLLSELDYQEGRTFIDQLSNYLMSNTFGVSPADLMNPEAILQAVSSCIDKISFLIQQEQEILASTQGQRHRPARGSQVSTRNEGPSARPSKKRRLEESRGSSGQSEPSNGEPHGSDVRSEGPQQVETTTTPRFPCPYRRRNPSRFNFRDKPLCAVGKFSSISQVK